MFRLFVAVPAASALRTEPPAHGAPETHEARPVQEFVNIYLKIDDWTVDMARRDMDDLCLDLDRLQETGTFDEFKAASNTDCQKIRDNDANLDKKELESIKQRLEKPMKTEHLEPIMHFRFQSVAAKSKVVIAALAEINVSNIQVSAKKQREMDYQGYSSDDFKLLLIHLEEVLLEAIEAKAMSTDRLLAESAVRGFYAALYQKLSSEEVKPHAESEAQRNLGSDAP